MFFAERWSGQPKPNVMTGVRAVPDGELKPNILFAAKQIQVAEGSGKVLFPENDGVNQPGNAFYGSSVRSVPARLFHGARNLFFTSHESDINRVGGKSVARNAVMGNVLGAYEKTYQTQQSRDEHISGQYVSEQYCQNRGKALVEKRKNARGSEIGDD